MAVADRGRDVRPVGGLLHGEARHRPGGGRRRRHHRAGRPRTSAGSPRPRRARPATSPSCILDRPRHEQLVQEVREAGARIKFITDGDVAGAIAAAREGTGVDLLLGIGGTPEGIIAACALKCMGGALQGKLWPKDDEERQKALDAGHDLDRVLHIDDLVRGDVFFVATGITDGELLRGVQYRAGGCIHAVPGHALAVGHHPLDRQPALAGEAARLLRGALRPARRAGLTARRP